MYRMVCDTLACRDFCGQSLGLRNHMGDEKIERKVSREEFQHQELQQGGRREVEDGPWEWEPECGE